MAPTCSPAGCANPLDSCTAAGEAILGGGGVAAGSPDTSSATPPPLSSSPDALDAHVQHMLSPPTGDGGAGAGGLGGADGAHAAPPLLLRALDLLVLMKLLCTVAKRGTDPTMGFAHTKASALYLCLTWRHLRHLRATSQL
jgi:hypothetical protein